MFKVGKKYKLKSGFSKINYECLFVGNTIVVLKNLNSGNDFSNTKNAFHSYEEVPEKLTYDRWHVLFADSSGKTRISSCGYFTKKVAEDYRENIFKGNERTAVVNIKHTVEVKD